MDVLKQIEKAWGWTGIRPVEVVGENDFGNLIVRDDSGQYWRITPEDLRCEVVAKNQIELDALSVDQEFLRDWYMAAMVAEAQELVGELTDGHKYCLKIPSVLGGQYGGDNLGSISLPELIAVSGHIASETDGLPDGTKVRLKIVD